MGSGMIMCPINHPWKLSVIFKRTLTNTSSTTLGECRSSKHTMILPYRCRVHASKTYNDHPHIRLIRPSEKCASRIYTLCRLPRITPLYQYYFAALYPTETAGKQNHNLFAQISQLKTLPFDLILEFAVSHLTITHEYMSHITYQIPHATSNDRRPSYHQRPCTSVREPITLTGRGGFLSLIPAKLSDLLFPTSLTVSNRGLDLLDFISLYIRLIYTDVIDAFEQLRSDECCPTGP